MNLPAWPLHVPGLDDPIIVDYPCPICDRPMLPEDDLWFSVSARYDPGPHGDGMRVRTVMIHHAEDCLDADLRR